MFICCLLFDVCDLLVVVCGLSFRCFVVASFRRFVVCWLCVARCVLFNVC